MYSFPNLEPVCCSMSRFNSCFLTCIQISQEAGQLVWYFHVFENFPQFVVSHTVKAFSTVFTKSHEIFNTSLKNVSGESRDITLPTNVCLVKTMVSTVVTYGYDYYGRVLGNFCPNVGQPKCSGHV